MVNPTHVTTLIAVLRTGSFASAARQLGYTGSAVSQQIAAFERETGLTLFERDARGIRPTVVAEQLHERAHEVFAAISSFDEHLRGLGQGTSGRIRLGSFPTASMQFVPSAIAEFVRGHPDVRIELDEGEPSSLIPSLESRELDVSLSYSYDLVPSHVPASLESTALLSEELIAFVPPGHPASGGTLRLRDLEDETWIGTRADTMGTLSIERACAAAGFTPRIRYRSNNYTAVASFVRSGLGIALIPALAATTLADGDADTARVDDLEVRRHVSLLVAPHAGNPAIPRLLETFRTVARRSASRSASISLAPGLSRRPRH